MSEEKHRLQHQADRAKSGSKRSVLTYLVILFAAAFILLLLSFLMERRSSEQAIGSLRESITSMETMDDVVQENLSLHQELEGLERNLASLEEQAALLQEERDAALQSARESVAAREEAALASKRLHALHQLSVIQALYDQGEHQQARNMIGLYDGLEEQLKEFSDNFLSDEGREIYDPLAAYHALVEELS